MKPRNPYIVLDVETGIEPNTMSGPGGQANPYAGVPLVAVGWAPSQYEVRWAEYWDGPGTRPDLRLMLTKLSGSYSEALIIVGHNVNFDLHHVFLEHTPDEVMKLLGNVTLWDTASAEYYLTGQRVKTTKLVGLERTYLDGGRDIDKDEMGELFKAGIGSDKIDKDKLLTYLGDDLGQTERVFLAQFEVAAAQGQLGFIKDMMDAQLVAFLMEKEGMPLDMEAVPGIIEEAEAAFVKAEAAAVEAMRHLYPMQAEYTPNPGSPTQVANALTGRPTRYVVKMPLLGEDGEQKLFKSGQKKGQPRFKNEDWHANPIPFPFDVLTAQNKEPTQQASTDEKALRALRAGVEEPCWAEFLTALLAWREADKVYNTYAKGYLTKVCPDGQLRTSINQTVTPTNRVSSSNVNLQNIPSED